MENLEPEVEVLRGRSQQVDFFDTMRIVKESGKRMLSNKEADAILQDAGLLKKYLDLFDCRTGTLVIYEAQDEPFSTYVKFDNLVFDVPKKFQGLKNKVLVIEHPRWDIETLEVDVPYGGKVKFTRINIDEKNIEVLDFPTNDGWYLPDEKHGIPNGEKSSESNKAARKLWRRDDEEYIGPLVRWDYDGLGYDGRRGVYADRRPVYRRGVGVVASESTKPAKGSSKKV